LSAHSAPHLSNRRELLGELLHSVCQPLTTLQCTLELSIDEPAREQQRAVAAALAQTETVIAMIRFIREYLETDAIELVRAIPLMPVLARVTEDLSTIAAVRGIRLQLVGAGRAELPLAQHHLRLALEYLILSAIEHSTTGTQINIRLHEGTSEAVLCVECKRARCRRVETRKAKAGPAISTTGRARLAIATRILDAAGASVVFDRATTGFSVSIPYAGASVA
jgi:signal transduction histidine kinase